ncbi:MAG TPA: hypothetical protein VN903_36500 [Polyangia bacterium]|nr:hypothetical protein [Polyangia bacterium]
MRFGSMLTVAVLAALACIVGAAIAGTYDPNLCGAFAHNNEVVTVPTGQTVHVTVDCSRCSTFVHNYVVTITDRHGHTPKATLAVYLGGVEIGLHNGHVTDIGDVSDAAVYDLRLASGKNGNEDVTLRFSGAITNP